MRPASVAGLVGFLVRVKLPEIPRPAEFRARRGTGAGAERAEHTLPDAEWRGTGPSQGGAECADPAADQAPDQKKLNKAALCG